MSYDIVEFEKITKEIAQMANETWKVNDYSYQDIDVIQCLRDYGDGKGSVVVTMAALRNPVDGLYDLTVNTIGDSADALGKLLEGVRLIKENGYLDRLKESNDKVQAAAKPKPDSKLN